MSVSELKVMVPEPADSKVIIVPVMTSVTVLLDLVIETPSRIKFEF